MKILHRILKYVENDVRKAILAVNLRGLRKSGVVFKSIRQALGSQVECKFTWFAQVWGDCQEQ